MMQVGVVVCVCTPVCAVWTRTPPHARGGVLQACVVLHVSGFSDTGVGVLLYARPCVCVFRLSSSHQDQVALCFQQLKDGLAKSKTFVSLLQDMASAEERHAKSLHSLEKYHFADIEEGWVGAHRGSCALVDSLH